MNPIKAHLFDIVFKGVEAHGYSFDPQAAAQLTDLLEKGYIQILQGGDMRIAERDLTRLVAELVEGVKMKGYSAVPGTSQITASHLEAVLKRLCPLFPIC